MRIEPLLLCPLCESFNAYGRIGQSIIWKTCSSCRALRTCGRTGGDRQRGFKSHSHLDEMFAKLFGKESL